MWNSLKLNLNVKKIWSRYELFYPKSLQVFWAYQKKSAQTPLIIKFYCNSKLQFLWNSFYECNHFRAQAVSSRCFRCLQGVACWTGRFSGPGWKLPAHHSRLRTRVNCYFRSQIVFPSLVVFRKFSVWNYSHCHMFIPYHRVVFLRKGDLQDLFFEYSCQGYIFFVSVDQDLRQGKL